MSDEKTDEIVTAIPVVEYVDACGTANDTWVGVPVDGVTYRQDANVTDRVVVIAQPEPGVSLEIAPALEGQAQFGLIYGDAGGISLAEPPFTDVACEEPAPAPGPLPEAPVTEPVEPVAEPMTELPATGVDGGIFLLVALGAALICAGLVSWLVVHGGRRAEIEAQREAELDR
jgi:hypothetical protein